MGSNDRARLQHIAEAELEIQGLPPCMVKAQISDEMVAPCCWQESLSCSESLARLLGRTRTRGGP